MVAVTYTWWLFRLLPAICRISGASSLKNYLTIGVVAAAAGYYYLIESTGSGTSIFDLWTLTARQQRRSCQCETQSNKQESDRTPYPSLHTSLHVEENWREQNGAECSWQSMQRYISAISRLTHTHTHTHTHTPVSYTHLTLPTSDGV